MTRHDIVILGGGPAGMAAAVAAYDAGATDVVILDRGCVPGGILQQCIHSGFGLHQLGRELTGPEYADVYLQKVLRRGIRIYSETTVTGLTPDRIITAQNRDGLLQIQAGAVIVSMGCRERTRGALNIPGTRPAGVYTAGTAQKMVNCMGWPTGKRAVILGSGDIGLIMARRLAFQGTKVEAVCEVMPYPGGLQRNIVQCLEDFGIPLYLRTTVVQIHGEKQLEGVTVAQVDSNRRPIEGTRRYIPCDTLLLSVGLIPENELAAAAGIPLDPATGGPVVDEYCRTQIPGIFACGNGLHVHDLVDDVSAEAERAGQAAAMMLHGNADSRTPIPIRAGEGIRYVLPQSVCGSQKEILLSLRVTRPFGPVRFTLCQGDRILTAFRRPKAVPGEMVKLPLSGAALIPADGPITVALEELA